MISSAFHPENILIIIVVLLVLFIAGIFYNHLIEKAEKEKLLEGYTALAVALGVLFTLAGVAVINWQAALLSLFAFVASGGPMLYGSLSRYFAAKKAERDYALQTQRLAEQCEGSEGPGR